MRLHRVTTGEWLLVLGGVASLVLGVLLVTLPGAGILTLVWLTGSYLLSFGVMLLVLAMRLHRRAPAVA